MYPAGNTYGHAGKNECHVSGIADSGAKTDNGQSAKIPKLKARLSPIDCMMVQVTKDMSKKRLDEMIWSTYLSGGLVISEYKEQRQHQCHGQSKADEVDRGLRLR